MKYIIIAALLALSTQAIADTYVNGYVKRDGTYVQGHFRSSPNNMKIDNYSSEGNTNIYTGKKGHEQHELSPPSYNTNQYNNWNSRDDE